MSAKFLIKVTYEYYRKFWQWLTNIDLPTIIDLSFNLTQQLKLSNQVMEFDCNNSLIFIDVHQKWKIAYLNLVSMWHTWFFSAFINIFGESLWLNKESANKKVTSL